MSLLRAILVPTRVYVRRSIVNGLRDDDGESFYGDRASFYSEYSVKDDNMKLFFKEHERKSSKGSVNSFLSRRKSQTQPSPSSTPQQPAKPAARPETKVCSWFSTLSDSQLTFRSRCSLAPQRRLVA